VWKSEPTGKLNGNGLSEPGKTEMKEQLLQKLRTQKNVK
jgi:hypothetical protein